MVINQLLSEKSKENSEKQLGGEVTYIAQQREQYILLTELERMKI